MSARAAALALLFLALGGGAGGAAHSQDLSPAAGAGPQPGAAALLDRALPLASAPAFTIEGGTTRWFALPELETPPLAAAARVRRVSAGAGVAQTGEPEFGWSTAAHALGSSGADGGMARRVAARHERRDGALTGGALARSGDLEGGAGAWLALGGAWRAWASAPH
ncbi:MAG: hypothetical protein HZA61_10810, partial [Candidatus Eisenbacteria bacterium]|nr:hypothetical protein [Candidatus Eisenbacteria bacterium]